MTLFITPAVYNFIHIDTCARLNEYVVKVKQIQHQTNATITYHGVRYNLY